MGKCVQCTTKADAKVFCVECKKSLCRYCAVLLHHPGTKDEKHSLEEIVEHQTPKVFTPLMLDFLLVGIAVLLLNGSNITDDYFKGTSYCPTLTRGRWWILHYDASIFVYLKGHLSTYCDLEDSYWRFFMDAWVRGIVTATDTWILMFSELFRALFFEEFVVKVFVPIAACIYALATLLVHQLERSLFTFIREKDSDDRALTKKVKNVAKVVTNISLSNKTSALAPHTLCRARPAQDWVDQAKYWVGRRVRWFSPFREQAQNVFSFALRGTLCLALAVRVFCMLTGHTKIFLLLAQLLGQGDLVDKHEDWFVANTGIEKKVRSTSVLDWLALFTLQQAWKNAKFYKAGEAVLSRVDLVQALKASFVVVVLVIPLFAVWTRIRKQRKEFAGNYEKYKTETGLSKMSRAEPMNDYENVWFAKEPKNEFN